MAQKIDADEMRDMKIQELQEFITDQKKKKINIFAEQPGSKYPTSCSESVSTVNRNIARAKTVLNERLDSEVN